MKRILNRLLGGFLVILMGIMVCSVLWQVVSRYIMGSPSSFTEELSRYLLIWLGILGAAYASGQQQHLAIDLLGPKLSEQGRIRLRIGINILIALFAFFVLVVGGANLVYINYELEQYSAALHVPLYLVYTVIPLSGLLIMAYKINELFNAKKYLS
ncbi:TRAP transporter small permease [Sinomicrobium soli]|uniref:TRAP transporter small permease n=1 Tax=Sinomicrobium sp. N-1-3-6 TaxID=2219864 RepID=UPI000DCD4B4B|nr:TRAP transporter small permease [Sinomicrobium sp. N-1-3-6]RAV28186.1 TRAP transporter small permease [Sinomicrobium sp. N-1-3-6]